MNKTLEFKWTVSRGRETYGYNIVTLYVNGQKASSCNGGGYDMEGMALGNYIAEAFPDRLLKLDREFYGLSFHDPNYKTPQTVIDGEKAGKSLGLERYQAFYSASSKLPDEKHTIPLINGATGFSSVTNIVNAIGFKLHNIPVKNKDLNIYQLYDDND